MDRDDPRMPPAPAANLPPLALTYSSLAPVRPGLATALAIVGIVVASLGILAAAYGAMTAMVLRSTALFSQTPGAAAVSIGGAIIGAILAATLMTASIGLLRFRPWSRRVMLWWAWVYLIANAVFLLLEIVVVVPSQMSMFTKMMSSMPTTAPTTSPTAAGGATASTSGGSTSIVTSSSGSTTTTTVTTSPPAFAPPMMAAVRISYIAMAAGKSVFCVILPIAVLIVMRVKSVRAALSPDQSVGNYY